MSPHLRSPLASRLLLSLLASLSAAPAVAQISPTPQPEGRLQFTGDTARVSVGYVSGGQFQGELSGVLREQADSAWLGEGWILGGAGGVQLSYHRLTGDTVQKYFLALDQNEKTDRKLTLGAGAEGELWFGHAYLGRSPGDGRLLEQSSTNTVMLQSGTDSDRPFIDTTTRNLSTQVFERAYDSGAGVRVGRYFDRSNIRVTAGVDMEWGRGDARQSNVSLLAEKFYVGTPHSLALQLDRLKKSGDAEIARDDTRITFSYRYSFGATNSQPQRMFRMVADPRPAVATPTVAEPTVIPARTERTLVKTQATMTSDAFFDIGSARLTSVARAELDRIAVLLKATPPQGNVRIVGHTCDLGSERLNRQLSIKRAQAVSDFLVASGALVANASVVEGKGKSEPKFPAKPDTRAKNRRVDLEFVTVVEKESVIHIPATTVATPTEVAPETPVTYHREVIDQEPAWLRRALRTPATHKRSVDVYRIKEESRTESTSRTWVNRTPVAQNDTYVVSGVAKSNLSVLSNDADPDGDPLTILALTQPVGNNGSVAIVGSQVVFTPKNGFASDSFTYTVSDGKGGQSTATVLLIDP